MKTKWTLDDNLEEAWEKSHSSKEYQKWLEMSHKWIDEAILFDMIRYRHFYINLNPELKEIYEQYDLEQSKNPVK